MCGKSWRSASASGCRGGCYILHHRRLASSKGIYQDIWLMLNFKHIVHHSREVAHSKAYNLTADVAPNCLFTLCQFREQFQEAFPRMFAGIPKLHISKIHLRDASQPMLKGIISYASSPLLVVDLLLHDCARNRNATTRAIPTIQAICLTSCTRSFDDIGYHRTGGAARTVAVDE